MGADAIRVRAGSIEVWPEGQDVKTLHGTKPRITLAANVTWR
jgi:hypothetical protein